MLENEKTNEKAQHGGGIIAKTLVVAVGNGAGNIVDEARRCNEVNGISFVYADTDSNCLQKHGESDAERITLGVDALQIQDYETIVLVACLGGQVTATYIEQVLKELRLHTSKLVSFITLPISFEGANKMETALISKQLIEQISDVVLTQANSNLPNVNVIEMNTAISGLLTEIIKREDKYDNIPATEWASAEMLPVALLVTYAKPMYEVYRKSNVISIQAKCDGVMVPVKDVLYARKTQRISQDGVKDVMRQMWRDHTSGKSSQQCNIFEVDLPPVEKDENN
jgi:hypothetical protein